jgi:hypothetical protein
MIYIINALRSDKKLADYFIELAFVLRIQCISRRYATGRENIVLIQQQ